jgi:DNA-directed RNA polymerase subunit M/transcription elongation factor TFIIS
MNDKISSILKYHNFNNFYDTDIDNNFLPIIRFVIPYECYKDKNYNKIRRNNLLLISDIIEQYIAKNNIDYNHIDISEIILKLELSIYNKILKKINKYKDIWDENFIFLYTSYSAKITKNLDTTIIGVDNYLIEAILNKRINIDKIINLKSYKLSPEKTKDLIKKINEQISIKDQDIFQKTSSMYKCRTCGAKKVIIKEFQARSLDEASNLSLTCTVCNATWVI